MTLTKNGAAAVVVSMTAVLPGVAVRDATSARGKEAAVTSAPGNVRAGLERLFDAEMAYRPGMAEVVSGEDREGAGHSVIPSRLPLCRASTRTRGIRQRAMSQLK